MLRPFAFALPMVLSASLAYAHAFVAKSTPPVGATVHVQPTQVAIDFSAEVNGNASTITVQDSNDKRVDDAQPHVAPGNARHLSVGLGALAPGAYRVEWHVTDNEGHKTQGKYMFTFAS